MTHHPIPNMNAPSTSATIPPSAMHDASQNPRGSSCIIDLPNPFLNPVAPSQTGNLTAAAFASPDAAAVISRAPGMALTQEQNSEPSITELPSFLRRARPAHDAIEPERVGGVIPIARKNNVATGERGC